MTVFDVCLLAMLAVLLVYVAGQELGKAVLMAMATAVAYVVTRRLEAPVCNVLGSPAMGPQVSALMFALTWAGGLWIAGAVHYRTRWNIDYFDRLASPMLGLVVVVIVGHVFIDVSVRTELQRQEDLPGFLANSVVAPELGEFRTPKRLLDAFQQLQRRGG